MHAFAILTSAAAACVVFHLLAMAAWGRLFGFQVMEIGLGFGPTWLRIGALRLGWLPFGGYVRFVTPPEEVLGTAAQLLLALAGTLTLVVTAIALLGLPALAAVGDGFWQWLRGATSPLGAAQSMLRHARDQALDGTLVATFGLVAAKVAALNFMPWPGTTGGQALAVLGRRLGLARHWPEALTKLLTSANLFVLVSWVVAVAVFSSTR